MPKLQDLTRADIPFRDRSFSVFNLGDWWGLILGAAVFMIIMALAAPVHTAISRLLAGLPIVGPHVRPAAPPLDVIPSPPTPPPAANVFVHPGLRVL